MSDDADGFTVDEVDLDEAAEVLADIRAEDLLAMVQESTRLGREARAREREREPLHAEDLSLDYVVEVTATAWAIAQTIARIYEPYYADDVAAEDLEPLTISAADAMALAAYVGVTVCLTAGEL